MKKYLREIEYSGLIIMFIGCILKRGFDISAGVLMVGIGILLWLTTLVYKSFHWEQYRKENIQNIIMMLFVIIMLTIIILRWYNQ